MTIEFTHVVDVDCRPGVPLARPFFDDLDEVESKLVTLERAGFQAIVIDDAGGLLTNMDLTSFAASRNSSINLILTHWAGVLEPSVAARQIAALDALSGGRLSLRTLPDPSGSQTVSHAALWQQLDEYLTLLKKIWNDRRRPVREGNFFGVRFRHRASENGRGSNIPIRIGGLSGTALKIAARHADIFELTPGSPAAVRRLIERVRTLAREYGRERNIRFALPVRFAKPTIHETTAGTAAGHTSWTASQLARYLDLGISEIMVCGLDEGADIVRFGEHTMPALQTMRSGYATYRPSMRNIVWP